MLSIAERLAQIPVENRVFYEWQFALSRRLCQIMEAGNITQSALAEMVGLTQEELDDLIHFCADPSLSTMARIAALSHSEILTWVNTDVKSSE